MSFLRKITRIDRSYANFRRYVEILDIIAKFGFEDLAGAVGWEKVHRLGCKIFWNDRKCENLMITGTRPERVRLLLEALGPTFVKLGQVLSSRPDLIPLEYVRELSKLQDSVPGFPGEEAKKIVEEELGHPVGELFQEFSVEPFAAASIGQVHKARLLNGADVVVKVQRPGIEPKVQVDLEIMYNIAERLEHSDLDLATLRPAEIVEEFSHVLTREMNYVVEATHARRFAEDMAEQPGVYVPKVYMELTSPKVLTMELVKGTSGSDVLAHEKLRAKFNLPLIAQQGADAVMAQIFEYGFFHADPHPGNLFLMEGDLVCFIDFGMMGRVTEQEKIDFMRAVNAMLDEEFDELALCVLKLAQELGGKPDMITLERDLADLVQENLYLPMDKLSLARILEQLMKTMSRHKLALRPDLFVMFKALMTIENVAREFDPDLQIVDILKRVMNKSRWSHFNLRRKLMKTGIGLEEWWALGNEFPPLARKFLRKASEGALLVKMEHHRLTPLLETFRYSIGMLSGAVIFASLLMSSALIVLSGVPPKWQGIPLFGVFGFLVAALLGLILMLRKRPR